MLPLGSILPRNYEYNTTSVHKSTALRTELITGDTSSLPTCPFLFLIKAHIGIVAYPNLVPCPWQYTVALLDLKGGGGG